jgi:competence protein ComFC
MGQLVREFKYHAALWLRHDFHLLLQAGMAAHYATQHIDAIVFVPLHPFKERCRTFNQAQVLGAGLTRHPLPLPMMDALRRLHPTKTQTHLTAVGRIANVKGVFQVKPRVNVQGLSLLLLDDVMTTGATVNECALALKQAGAAQVYVLTLARG